MKTITIFLVILFISQPLLFAQENKKADKPFNYDPDNYDLMGLFKSEDNNTEKVDSSEIYKTHWAFFPAIATNPAIGTGYGFGVTAGKYFGDPKTTRMSVLNSTPLYTSKKQIFVPIRATIFTKDEKYFLNGTYIWRYFPLGTYGLGTNTIDYEGDMLDSKTVTFWQSVNKKIAKGIFIGLGYTLDYYYDVKDVRAEKISNYLNEHGNITAGEIITITNELYERGITPTIKQIERASDFVVDMNGGEKSKEEIQKEYLPTVYQEYYDEVPEDVENKKEISSAIMLNFIIDTRDNSINPYEGMYFNTYTRLSREWLGSSTNYTFLAYDYRQYWKMPWLNKNILAVWFTGAFTFGQPVYTGLPAVGTDPFLRTGRGWTPGRLKGMDMMYTEIEYRLPVYKMLGIDLFVNAAQFSDVDHNFQKLKLGYGLGLRLKLNKTSRSNFALDFGWNEQGYAGFYMQLNETF
ncbi:MAG: BamA/TamA family outer membrane protein [Bacteroidota bacterium]